MNGLPWKWTEIILSFLRLHPSTAFQTLLITMRTTPFLIRDSCHSSRYNGYLNYIHPFWSILVHWFLEMSIFTLAICCLTTSSLPCHGPNVPGSYALLLLEHRTLLSPPGTSTTGRCFHFSSASSFLLELFLHCSPVAYWARTNLGSSSFSVISFCLFILFVQFSRQDAEEPFPSPVEHILSELSTISCPSWVALHGMTHSFIELGKAVIHVISFLWLWFSFCLPSDHNLYICVCVCVCVLLMSKSLLPTFSSQSFKL